MRIGAGRWGREPALASEGRLPAWTVLSTAPNRETAARAETHTPADVRGETVCALPNTSLPANTRQGKPGGRAAALSPEASGRVVSLGRACGRRLQSTRVGRAGRGVTLRPGGRARWRAGTVARRGGPWVRQFEFGLGSYRHRNRTGATTMSSSPRRGRAGLWGLGVSGRACEAMSGAAGVGVRPQLAACICGPRASRLCGAVFFSQPARRGQGRCFLKRGRRGGGQTWRVGPVC